ncbi:MAG: RNA polymerase sigma factor RpoD/SigA [Candidatus Brocadiia bacterium]
MRQESPLTIYLRELSKVELLSKDEEKKCAALCRKGNKKAREKMIRSNLKLVVHIAKVFTGRGLPLEDLIEEGNIGLLKAVNKFNPRRNVRFSTYASWWIEYAIKQAIIKDGKSIRLPYYMVELLAKWKSISEELCQKIGHQPSPQEITQKLDIPPEKIKIVKHVLRNGFVTGRIFSIELLSGAYDILPDEKNKSVEIQVFDKSDIELINKLLSQISQREALILRLRYGLDLPTETRLRKAPRTLRQIGKITKLSKEGVRLIIQQALKKIHDYLKHLKATN